MSGRGRLRSTTCEECGEGCLGREGERAECAYCRRACSRCGQDGAVSAARAEEYRAAGGVPYCASCWPVVDKLQRRARRKETVVAVVCVAAFIAFVGAVIVAGFRGDDDDGPSHPAEIRAERVCGELEGEARRACVVRVFDDYGGG